MVAQEVELLEMLEAETRSAGGVDFDGASDAERVRDCCRGAASVRSPPGWGPALPG